MFFLSESRSGLVVGMGDLPDPALKRFHLTAVRTEQGFRSHITDQEGKIPPRMIPPKTQADGIKLMKRLRPSLRKYRKNEVAWLPIGSVADQMDGLLKPEVKGGKEQIPIERFRAPITFDLRNPKHFRKIRVAELAESGKIAFRIDGGRLYAVVATRDGILLKMTPRRLQNFVMDLFEFAGFNFDEYLVHLDTISPPVQVKKNSDYPQRVRSKTK